MSASTPTASHKHLVTTTITSFLDVATAQRFIGCMHVRLTISSQPHICANHTEPEAAEALWQQQGYRRTLLHGAACRNAPVCALPTAHSITACNSVFVELDCSLAHPGRHQARHPHVGDCPKHNQPSGKGFVACKARPRNPTRLTQGLSVARTVHRRTCTIVAACENSLAVQKAMPGTLTHGRTTERVSVRTHPQAGHSRQQQRQ
jgi:hypothetical protein